MQELAKAAIRALQLFFADLLQAGELGNPIQVSTSSIMHQD